MRFHSISILFCSLLSPLVLRTRSRPQNVEFGPVPSCDKLVSDFPRRPRRVYMILLYTPSPFLPFAYIIPKTTVICHRRIEPSRRGFLCRRGGTGGKH